jgi:hypothetical protein
MSNLNEMEDHGSSDIIFDKEIGEESTLVDKFCYVFAQRKLQALVDQLGYSDEQLVFRGNIQTFTHILASMIDQYATKLFDDMDRAAGYAKQK